MFEIQVSSPRFIKKFNKDVDNIGDAIESIFLLHSEFAVIRWNYIPILLSYKYDISVIIDDVLYMLNKIRIEPSGEMTIRWPSNTFESSWDMRWDINTIEVNSHWNKVIGDTESLLNLKKIININTKVFAREWKKILETIIIALNVCGYKKENLQGFSKLYEEFKEISQYGVLYQ